MIGVSERISARFQEWEARGRGYQVWPEPVRPEPPFVPFLALAGKDSRSVADDGVRPTFTSSLIRRVMGRTAAAPTRSPVPAEVAPEALSREDIVEIQAWLSDASKASQDAYARFFATLAVCVEPVAFEIVGIGERIAVQFAVSPCDEALVSEQLRSFFPDVEFSAVRGCLESAWQNDETERVAVEFSLGKEFMIPFAPCRGDPFVGIVGALSEIRPDETAAYQVIFESVSGDWAESAMQSVTHRDGSALFVNAPELLPGAKDKTAHPLYAAVIRLAVLSPDADRVWEIACNVAGALGVYGSPRGNELMPLRNDGYAYEDHIGDVVRRQTRRSGLILNAEELAGFVHLPSPEVRSPRLRRSMGRTKRAPNTVRQESGLRLGTNEHAGISAPVSLTEEARVRHIHVVGASGTGKSTLLFNLIRQDIEQGYGCSVLDPHGDLIDRVLGIMPEERMGNVVILDPSDEEYAVGFNILSAHSDWEKNLIASDLVAVFRRLSTSWGDQLNSVLSNALLAFMESDRGGTLFDVRRFLLEPAFRADFLKSVRDPNVSYYWQKAFPMLTGNKSVGPVVTRLDTFLSPKPIRYMVAQKVNRLDFRDIMGNRKIFLAKLPEGMIGKENSHLLGSLLVSKIQAAAMSRQRERESSRTYHTLYADEFHSFLTPSLAECLSGVRKYRLGLVLAHQEMRQVERDWDVASALLNAGTRIAFRVNERDARLLEGGYSNFEARDLQNLSTGSAICRVERSDNDFNLKVELTPYPGDREAELRREKAVTASRARYGTPRAEVERAFIVSEEAPQPEARKPASGQSVPDIQPSAHLRPAKIERKAVEEMKGEGVVAPAAVPSEPVPAPRSTEAPAVVSLPEPKAEKAPPALDLGRGGAQHKAIQERIKNEAERLGFRVTVEKEVLGGAGQIDLVLVRDDEPIACEVTVTGTIDYEVGNVAKCLKAGFTRMAVVAVAEEKLQKLSAAVLNSLGADKAGCVEYYLPDAFIESLRALPKPKPELPPAPVARTRGGRVVKRKVVALSAGEAKAKEEEALKIMSQMMKQKTRRE